MSASVADLRKTIGSAEDLHSVVRTMKALAASSIAQYEHSVLALAGYARTVELGLGVCIRNGGHGVLADDHNRGVPEAIVFGSDQGLVGRFNDVVAEHAIAMLADKPNARVWAVGERVEEPLKDAALEMAGLLAVPLSVDGITPLVDQILIEYEAGRQRGAVSELHLVYNRPSSGTVYEPVTQRLLPLDESWRANLSRVPWPAPALPEVLGDVNATLGHFVREYLFVSLFRACAASLASENSSRLAAMQRADKNIDTMLDELNGQFHSLRQDEIDEELFDVVAGYEAMNV